MKKSLSAPALLLLFTGVAPAVAQPPQFELVPFVGAFVPLGDLSDQPLDIGGTTLDRAKQATSLAFGGRAVLWLAGPVGVEGSLFYAPSEAETTVAGVASEQDAYVWAGAGRLLLKLGVPGAPVHFLLDGGVAVIGRGGDAYNGLNGTSKVGGVAGVAGRFGLSDRLAIRLDAESYLYRARLRPEGSQQPIEFDSKLQGDIVLSAGLVIRLRS